MFLAGETNRRRIVLAMRGDDTQQSTMFSYLSPEERVPASHPLRPIRLLVDRILLRLNRRFEEMYASTGRPSIAPDEAVDRRTGKTGSHSPLGRPSLTNDAVQDRGHLAPGSAGSAQSTAPTIRSEIRRCGPTTAQTGSECRAGLG